MACQLQTVASSAPFLVGSFAIDYAQFGVLIGLCPAAGHFYGLAGRHARAAFRRQTVGIGRSAVNGRRGSADGGRFVIPSGCSRPQIARFRCCSVSSLSRHSLITKTGIFSVTGVLRSRYKWYWATGCFLRADDQMAGCRSAFSSGGFICRNEYSSATS